VHEAHSGVGFQVHRRVPQRLAALIVVRRLADRLAQNVKEGRNDVKRFALITVFTGSMQPAAAEFVGV
jgi:hypothetical protein